MTVNPGGLLVAEGDIVCVRSQATRRHNLSVASQGREVDARCLKDIQSGVSVAEASDVSMVDYE